MPAPTNGPAGPGSNSPTRSATSCSRPFRLHLCAPPPTASFAATLTPTWRPRPPGGHAHARLAQVCDDCLKTGKQTRVKHNNHMVYSLVVCCVRRTPGEVRGCAHTCCLPVSNALLLCTGALTSWCASRDGRGGHACPTDPLPCGRPRCRVGCPRRRCASSRTTTHNTRSHVVHVSLCSQGSCTQPTGKCHTPHPTDARVQANHSRAFSGGRPGERSPRHILSPSFSSTLL